MPSNNPRACRKKRGEEVMLGTGEICNIVFRIAVLVSRGDICKLRAFGIKIG